MTVLFPWMQYHVIPSRMRETAFWKKKYILTFKGINFQWFHEHLVYINVLEVNAFKGTVQAVGKRASTYKMVPIYEKEGSAHSSEHAGGCRYAAIKSYSQLINRPISV